MLVDEKFTPEQIKILKEYNYVQLCEFIKQRAANDTQYNNFIKNLQGSAQTLYAVQKTECLSADENSINLQRLLQLSCDFLTTEGLQSQKDEPITIYCLKGSSALEEAQQRLTGLKFHCVDVTYEWFNFCILHNLRYCDFDERLVVCSVCGESYPIIKFNGEGETYTHNCKGVETVINKQGEVERTGAKVHCPRCNGVFTQYNKDGLCPECSKHIDDKHAFFAALDLQYYAEQAERDSIPSLMHFERLGYAIPHERIGYHGFTYFIAEEVKHICQTLLSMYTYYNTVAIDNVGGVVVSLAGSNSGAVKHTIYDFELKQGKPVYIDKKESVYGMTSTSYLDACLSYIAMGYAAERAVCKDRYYNKLANKPNILEIPKVKEQGRVYFGDAKTYAVDLQKQFNTWNNLEVVDKGRIQIGVPGFHLPHLKGYVKVGESTFKKIDFLGELTQSTDDTLTKIDFGKWFLEEVYEALTDYIYLNREQIKLPKGRTLMKYYTALKTCLDGKGNKDLVACDIAISTICDFLSSTVYRAVRRCFLAVAVVRKFTKFDVFFDLMSDVVYDKDNKPVHLAGECANTLLNDNIFENKGGGDEQSGGKLVNQMSTVPMLSKIAYSISILQNAAAKLAMPNFAYIPVQKLKDKGIYKSDEFIIGETTDGDFVKISKFVETGQSMSIFATSRAGKGVLTLAMLGNIMSARDVCITYADCKPEMSCVLTELEVRLCAAQQALQRLGYACREPRFLSNEYMQWINAPEMHRNFKCLSEVAQVKLKSRQSRWLGVSAGSEYLQKQLAEKFGNADFSITPEMYTYLLYTRHIAVLYALTRVLAKKEYGKKLCIILDEVNQAASLYAEPAKLASIIYKTKGKDDRLYKWLTTRFGEVTEKQVTPSSMNILSNSASTIAGLEKLNAIRGTVPVPSFILIGQNFVRLANPTQVYKNNSKSADVIGTLINDATIKIQGNWDVGTTGTEDAANAENHVVLQAVAGNPALGGALRLMHPGKTGHSGYFAILENGKSRVFNSYFVLNENTVNYTDGGFDAQGNLDADNAPNAVRARYKQGLGEKPLELSEEADVTLSKILYTDVTAAEVTPQLGEDLATYIKRLDRTCKRRKEVGFYGYISLASGRDFLAGSQGTLADLAIDKMVEGFKGKSEQELKGICDYINNFADSYTALKEAFESLAICKLAKDAGLVGNENPLEDFLYCSDMRTFPTLAQLSVAATDTEGLEKLRAELAFETVASEGETDSYCVPIVDTAVQAENEKACAELETWCVNVTNSLNTFATQLQVAYNKFGKLDSAKQAEFKKIFEQQRKGFETLLNEPITDSIPDNEDKAYVQELYKAIDTVNNGIDKIRAIL